MLLEKTNTKTSREIDFSLNSAADAIKKELAEQKKGGPYPKLEQDKRRMAVFNFHFEKGYSAVKIAEMLGVNRNTVNEDIKYLYAQTREEIQEHTLETWALKQYQRMEIQRNRLLGAIEEHPSFQVAITLEKMLADLDKRINEFVLPLIKKHEYEEERNEITEDIIKEIVEYLILNEDIDKVSGYQKDDLSYDIIKMKKCHIDYASRVINRMDDLGLEVCKVPLSFPLRYDLTRFAKMWGMVSERKIKQLWEKFREKRMQEDADADDEIDDSD